MNEPWKEKQIEGRLARLERDFAHMGGRTDMMGLAVLALIGTHPEPDAVRAALRPFLASLQSPNPAYREGFDQALLQVKAALTGHPTIPSTTQN